MARRSVIAVLLWALSTVAHGQTPYFNLFQPPPSPGVMKGTPGSYITTNAAASDIVAPFNSTSTCTSPSTEFLRADGICAVPAGSGSGSVTSVALSAPASLFSISGSPITGSGTLALSYATGQAPTELFGTDGSGNVSLFALTGNYVPPINLASTSNGGIANTLGVAHGGSGATTLTAHGVLIGEGTSAITALTALGLDTLLQGQGASADPAAVSLPNCGSGTQALSYSTSTHTFGCQTISAGTGSVTSVGLSAPSVFSVSGTPVTSSGTLALSFAGSQTANQGLFTPNGTTGPLGLRSMVAADLPGTINSNTTGSAATVGGFTPSQTAGVASRVVVADGSGYINNTYFNSSDNSQTSGITGIMAKAGDNNLRTGTAQAVASFLSGSSMNIVGNALTATGLASTPSQCGVGSFSTGITASGNANCSSAAGTGGANPTASVGLTAVNGTATTFMRSDAAPPLSQSISPTMTGNWTFSPSSGHAIQLNGAANSNALEITASPTTGQSYGLGIAAGTNSSDYAALIQNRAVTETFFALLGNGSFDLGYNGLASTITGSSSGNVTINPPSSGVAFQSNSAVASLNAIFNGGAIATGNLESSDSTRTNRYTFGRDNASTGNWVLAFNGTELQHISNVGNVTINAPSSGIAETITGVSGSAAVQITGAGTVVNSIFAGGGSTAGNIESSDGGQVNKYTFGRDNATTGNWVLAFNGTELQHITSGGNVTLDVPASGSTLVVNGVANAAAIYAVGSATTGQSYGIGIQAGTNSSDLPFSVSNQAGATRFFSIWGDGGLTAGSPTGGDKGLGSINAQSIFVQNVPVLTTSGNAATASALASTPSQCTSGQFATGVAANGNANCSAAPSYSSGSFTATLSGVSGTVTGTVNYVVIGGIVTLFANSSIQGTSTTTGLGISGLPSAVQPSSLRYSQNCGIVVDASLATVAVGQINGSSITFYPMGSSSVGGIIHTASGSFVFTNSGTKGLQAGWTCTYPL